MDDINKYAANKLKELRVRKNITQEELAEDLNIKQQQIARYENNLRRFKQDFLFQLADYFKVSINDFFPPVNIEDSQDAKYKKLLKEKGLMDDNGKINEQKLNKLLKIADFLEDTNKK